jgi:hypothetical protein
VFPAGFEASGKSPRAPVPSGGYRRGEDRTGLRREVARIGVNALIGGSTNIEGVVPGSCSGPGLGLTCVAGVPGGVRSSGKSPRAPVPSGGYRREADRTGEELEPLADVSLRSAPRWDAVAEYKDWPLRSGRRRLGSPPSREEHRCPRGTGGTHPGRSSCVRNAVTPVEVRSLAGKPTVRKAQSLGGILMTEKRMPAAERQQETRIRMAGPSGSPSWITGRIRDIWCPDAKAC